MLGRGDFFRLSNRGVLSMMECRTALPHQSHPISTHPLLECRPCQLTDTVQIISSGLCQRICCRSQRADLKHLGTCSFTQHICQPLKVIVSSPFFCFFDQCSHPYMDCDSVTYARDESVPFAWPPAPSVKGSIWGTTCQEAGNRNKLRHTSPHPPCIVHGGYFWWNYFKSCSPGIPHPDISAHLPHLLSALMGFQLQIIPIKPLQWFFTPYLCCTHSVISTSYL